MSTTKPAAATTAVNVTLLLWSCIVAANFFNTDASVVGMIAPTLITSEGASSSLVSLISAIFTLMVAALRWATSTAANGSWPSASSAKR